MAALSITAANVRPADAVSQYRTAKVGEAVTAGQQGYKDSNNVYWLAKSDTAANANASVVFMSSASADEFVAIAERNMRIEIGATLSKGERYYVGSTAGDVIPSGDLGSGDFVTETGIAETTSTLLLKFDASGVDIP